MSRERRLSDFGLRILDHKTSKLKTPLTLNRPGPLWDSECGVLTSGNPKSKKLKGGNKMKTGSRAMVLTAPQTLEKWNFDLPAISDDDGLLEVELVGVCGSDPGIYDGRPTRGPRPFPIILGHEIVGRVREMGQTAQNRLGVRVGDRVVLEYAFSCGACDSCISGNYTICERNYTYGSMISCQDPPHLFGGYSDYVYIHPRAMVHKVGDDISPEVAVLICAVLGNGIRWLRQIGGVSIGDTVAIVGPGQQGLAGVAVAKESGADPIIVVGLSRDMARLEMAKRFGADWIINADETDPIEALNDITGGKMADVVMDVSGNPAGAELALFLAGRRATIVLPGIYKRKKASLDLDQAVFNEIKLVGAFSHDFRAVRPAIKMAKQGRYPFSDLITHRFPLKEAERAIRLVGGKEEEMPLKVVLDPKME
jgi:alcohol dehydrogenase